MNLLAIRKAFELGIQTFDTAEGYGQGHSETIVGQALEGKRKDCVISTKVSPTRLKPDDVRRSADNSLKRLRTDTENIRSVDIQLTPDELLQLDHVSAKVIADIDGGDVL